MGLRIDALFAWIIVDDDGDEALPAALGPGGTWFPLVGADEARIRSLQPYAADAGRQVGRPVRLVRFDSREELEVLEPGERRTKH